MQRQYWQFFWPLSLTGLAMLLARQFQNGTLARFPEAVDELAIYAYATCIFMLFNAMLAFVPQMANVFARSPQAERVCLRFVATLCVTLTAPVAMLAFAPAGRTLIAKAFDIDGARLAEVLRYLRYMMPLIAINGLRHFYKGMLIQAKRTGVVTGLTSVFLVVVVAMLLVGLRAGWSAAKTIVLAQVTAGSLDLMLAFVLRKVLFVFPERQEHQALTYRETFSFFWPVATTAAMFALSRPILYSFVSRMPDGRATVAALRVSFDFAMVFHNPINQFRHLVVTFGRDNLKALRTFMMRIWTGVTVVMILIAATPLSNVIFHSLLGIEGRVLGMTRSVIWVLCFVPLALTIRNYFHGLSLVGRKTRVMAIGAICRNITTYMLAWALYEAGWLDHVYAASILVLGFATEAAVMVANSRLVARSRAID